MTNDFEKTPPGAKEAQGSNELPRPLRTLEDWQQNAAKLEAKRDSVRALLLLAGENPDLDPQYAHLLGRISVAQTQIIHFQTEVLEQQFEG